MTSSPVCLTTLLKGEMQKGWKEEEMGKKKYEAGEENWWDGNLTQPSGFTVHCVPNLSGQDRHKEAMGLHHSQGAREQRGSRT